MSKAKPEITSEIEAHILKVTEQKAKKKNEAPAKYRDRLVRAVSDLEDDQYASLSEEEQEWANEGVKAIREKSAVPDFPDMADEDEEEEETTESKESEDESVVEAPALKKRGGPQAVREIVIESRGKELGIDEIAAAAVERGFDVARSSIEYIADDTRKCLATLETMGLLEG